MSLPYSSTSNSKPLRRFASFAEIAKFDLQFRAELRLAHASPFLGQYDLPAYVVDGIDVHLCASRPLDALLALLRNAPTAAIGFVAKIAAEKTGSESFAEFYPHLEQRLDYKLSNSERRELWSAFRRACLALMLPVATLEQVQEAGTWATRLEYLMQAGVIHADLPALAGGALDVEERAGLPDILDPDQVRAWQMELVDAFPHGHKVLKRILDLDTEGWHARAIARLRNGAEPSGRFERALAEALSQAAAAPRSGAVGSGRLKPEIRIHGGQIVLRTPDRPGTRWSVDAGWASAATMGANEDISLPIAEQIRWRTGAPEDDWRWLPLWAGSDLLVFDATSGRLLRRLAKGASTEIDATEVLIATREPLRFEQYESQSIDGQVWLMNVKLAGSRVAMEPWLTLKPRPMLRWTSMPVLHFEGRPVFGAEAIMVEADLSPEQLQSWGTQFELVARMKNGANARFPFDFTDPRRPRVTVDTTKLDLGCFGLIAASLVQTGAERPLISAPSAWLWPSLLAFDGARFEGPPPDNLDRMGCKGVQIDEYGVSLTIEDDRLAELAFRTDERSLRFRLPRQGVALELEEQGSRRPIAAGQTLTDDGRPRRLRIWTSDAKAALQVGHQIVRAAFAPSGHRTVTLNGLASTGSVAIRYWRGGLEADAIDLLTLGRPATPERAELLKEGGSPTLRLCLSDSVDSFEFACFDLIGGREFKLGSAEGVEARADRDGWKLRPPRRALGEGAWLIEVHAVLKGEASARPVRTPRGDRFGLLAPIDEHGMTSRLADLDIRGPVVERRLFVHLSKALASCWAEVAWFNGGLEQIEAAWRRMGSTLAERFNVEDHSALLMAAGQPAPFDSHSSWVPMRHPIELAPQLFSGPLSFIRDQFGSSVDDGCRCFAAALAQDVSSVDRHDEALQRFEERLAAARGANDNMNLERLGRLSFLARQAGQIARSGPLPPSVAAALMSRRPEHQLSDDVPALATLIAQYARDRRAAERAFMTEFGGERPAREVGLFLRLAPELFALHLKLWTDLIG